MMLWEILKASKGILVADLYADLWANIAGGGTPVDVFVEMIGSLPLYYNGKGYDLTDYLISGNTVQDGTPSADAPVDATGSGVRTGNLFDINATPTKHSQSTTVAVDGQTLTITGAWYIYYEIDVAPNTDYYVKWTIDYASVEGRGTIAVLTTSGNAIKAQGTQPFQFNSGENQRIRLYIYSGSGTTGTVIISNLMLNLGSTALPYEPYGFKLSPTVNGTEYPIYLGQVETTRRVKKLVLTGEEAWQLWNGNYYSSVIDRKAAIDKIVCSHFINSSTGGISYNRSSTSGLKIAAAVVASFVASVADLKAWLSDQYAAGTPVTVWYVLAEPETAVVNEPLMKIGEYADTVSFAQAGVTIPTVSGANVLDMTSPVKPSEVYVKGKGIKPTGYGQLVDANDVDILDKDGTAILVHGQ